jgi:hypothetical protein
MELNEEMMSQNVVRMNSNKKGRSTRSKGRQNDGASPT